MIYIVVKRVMDALEKITEQAVEDETNNDLKIVVDFVKKLTAF